MAVYQHVVIVDDDPVMRETISAYFEQEGFKVSATDDYEGLQGILSREKVDILLLDIRLPGVDGLSIMRELRQHSDLAVILVTGRTDEVDRVLGLELGADDYVTKPFSPRELLARARTVLRRAARPPAPSTPGGADKDDGTLSFAGWCFDPQRRRLTAPDGEEVRLTRGNSNCWRRCCASRAG